MVTTETDPEPIFIVGAPRSGTTLLLELLAAHPDLCWLSAEMSDAPHREGLARRQRVYRLPFIGSRLYANRTRLVGLIRPTRLRHLVRRYLPYPVEPWGYITTVLPTFWPRPGSGQPNRPPDGSWVTDADVARMVASVAAIREASDAPRFLSKFAEYAHIDYLQRIFPTARFVHITRDGRAASYSYLQKIESREWDVWPARDWYIEGWSSALREEWEASAQTQLVFSVIMWKHFVSTILEEAAVPGVGARVLDVRYEDLVSDPIEVLDRVTAFAGLTPSSRLRDAVGARRVRSENSKWRAGLAADDQAEMGALIHEPPLRDLLDAEAV